MESRLQPDGIAERCDGYKRLATRERLVALHDQPSVFAIALDRLVRRPSSQAAQHDDARDELFSLGPIVTGSPPFAAGGQGGTIAPFRGRIVAGTVAPGGVLVFDLYSVGAPRQRLWPVPFEPFDFVPHKDGGVWILDRALRAVWQLDRRFEVVADGAGPALATSEGGFAPEAGDVAAANVVVRLPVRPERGMTVAAADAIAIEVLPDGAVLVLDRDDGSGFGRVYLLEGGTRAATAVSLAQWSSTSRRSSARSRSRLVAHDFALGNRDADDPAAWIGRLYVVGQDGNQAYAFGVMRGATSSCSTRKPTTSRCDCSEAARSSRWPASRGTTRRRRLGAVCRDRSVRATSKRRRAL